MKNHKTAHCPPGFSKPRAPRKSPRHEQPHPVRRKVFEPRRPIGRAAVAEDLPSAERPDFLSPEKGPVRGAIAAAGAGLFNVVRIAAQTIRPRPCPRNNRRYRARPYAPY